MSEAGQEQSAKEHPPAPAALDFIWGEFGAKNRLAREKVLNLKVSPLCGRCEKPLLRAYDRPFDDLDPDSYIHRLDKETTGVLVFARTHEAQERLKSQFRFHTTERRYLAIVHGHPKELTYRSNLVVNRGDGLRGSTENANLGKESVTHIEVLERFAQASLIRCRLETGRTHQIRIHLSEAGHPLLGERVYTRGFSGRQLSAPRVMLHAASLGFDHPLTGARITHELPLPADMADVLLRLRRGAST